MDAHGGASDTEATSDLSRRRHEHRDAPPYGAAVPSLADTFHVLHASAPVPSGSGTTHPTPAGRTFAGRAPDCHSIPDATMRAKSHSGR